MSRAGGRAALAALLAALLLFPARSQAPDPGAPPIPDEILRRAERELWMPGESRALRRWLVRSATGPLDDEPALAPSAADDRWSPYAAWTDVVELSPPGDRPQPRPRTSYVYATTLVERAEAGPADLVFGTREPLRIWLNGELVGDFAGADALVPDAERVPVRLRAGANRIVVRAEHDGPPARLTMRLLSPRRPLPAVLAPSLAPQPDGRLAVRTDAAGRTGSARVVLLGIGGRLVAEQEAGRGQVATFDTASLADGPYEVRVVAPDAFGLPQTRYLPWYKGDPLPAARALLARAAAASGGDAVSGHWRMLAALLTDRAGADLAGMPSQPDAVHSMLTEAAELGLGSEAVIRPSGFVRLAWIDEVDGSTQFCRAYLPPGYDPAQRWPTVVYLHGYNPENPPYIRFWNVDRRHDDGAERWNVVWIDAHGRANAQYGGIGERDVLRCLDEARRRLSVDDDRVYLTGESMGGSGSWLIGSRHPDRFAAIAPIFGGWDLRLTPGSGFANPGADRPMERWLAEAQSSFAAAEQLIATPVFLHHGDADAAVDVLHSRHIVERLQRWGYDVRYREYPGWAHEDLQFRDEVAAWLLRHRRAEAPRQVRIRSVDLAGARAWWVRVDGAERPLELIEADAEMTAPGTLRLDSRNVATVTLTPPPTLAGDGPLRVIWNGRAVAAAAHPNGGFRLIAPDAPDGRLRKRANLEGGLSNAFETPFVIVVGTIAADPAMRILVREKAEELAGQWQAWQHVRPRLVEDVAVTPAMERSLSLVLIGGPRENAVSRRLAGRLPYRIGANAVTIDGRRFAATDAALELIYPSPLADDRYVVVVAATSAAGLRHWQAGFWHPILGYRTNFYDWTLRDGRAPALDPGLLPERGWLAAGLFDQNWRRDDRWTFLGDPALRRAGAGEGR